MNEENRHYLGNEASMSFMKIAPSDLEISSKSFKIWMVIAKDLETMASGEFCLITGTKIKKDPNEGDIEKYKDRLYEALVAIRREDKFLGDVERDYEFKILPYNDGYQRLKVIRK